MRFTQITEHFFLFQLNNFSTFLTSLNNSRVNHARSWMDWCSKSFPGWKEDSEGWLCTDPCWICSEVIANILFLLTWLSMFRWPAYTWGQINAPPPNHRRSLNRILNKLRLKGTVQDLRKRRPSAREGVEEVTNNDKVEEVSAQLDAESERRADEPGSSTRRNPFNISPSSFWKIAKKKLKLHPFKLRKHQKLRRGNAVRRLAACGWLAAR